MIPAYLQYLAATVRDLVASGKAVHVTNETAAELDLLAGLPWNAAERACAEINQAPLPVSATLVNSITPADLALGWLLLSCAERTWMYDKHGAPTMHQVTNDAVKRAAECAELAAISASHVVNGRLALQRLGTGNPLRTIEAHDGTREGARAAWGFVVQCIEMQQRNSMVAHAFEGKPQTWQTWQGMRDRYRRELEAM